MTQTTPPGPIAEKLLHALARARGQKIVDLKAFATARRHEAELQRTAATRDTLADLHPVHAIYSYVQNQVSIMSETITQLPMLDKLTAIVVKAEDTYMPSGPPMSPLTGSYFFCWAVFDAAVGASRETIGTCILALTRWAGSHPEFIRLIGAMPTGGLMKYGLKLNYWNEYIFEAYAGHETSAVFLRGLPDVDASRPHSRKFEDMRERVLAGGARGRRGRT